MIDPLVSGLAAAHRPLVGFVLLALAAPSARAQCPPDAFEPNDACSQIADVSLGSHGGLTVQSGDGDFFRVLVPAGHRLEARVELAAPDPSFFATFRLWRDDGSAVPCDAPTAQLALELLESNQTSILLAWSADQGAATSFVVGFESFVGACADYSLELSAVADPCAALAVDAFEPNDGCASPAGLATGSFPDLTVSVGDLDYYLVQVGANELVTLAISASEQAETFEVFAWEGGVACGLPNELDAGTAVDGGTSANLFLPNDGASATTYVVAVTPRPVQASQTGFCASYSLVVTSDLDPCGALSGDALEPNDSCASPAPLASSQSGLSIAQSVDQDWFGVLVPAHSTVRLLATSASPIVQRPMHLYSGCGGNPDFLASSHPVYFDLDSRHFLKWSNTSSFAVDTRLFVINPAGALFCDVYDLDLELTLGVPFCPVAKNSTGEAARLSASGSTTPGVGTLALQASPVPANKSGLVIMSTVQKSPTLFGQGFLCLGSPIVRFPVTTTGTGVLATTIDWTGAAAQISAGETWCFQTWFRDPAAGGAGFNLSEGLRIDFQ